MSMINNIIPVSIALTLSNIIDERTRHQPLIKGQVVNMYNIRANQVKPNCN